MLRRLCNICILMRDSDYDDNRIRYLNVTITFKSVYIYLYQYTFLYLSNTKKILMNFSIVEFHLVKFTKFHTFFY